MNPPVAALSARLRIHAIAEDDAPGNGDYIAIACAHCQAEWRKVYDRAREQGESVAVAKRAAAIAYKLSLPDMTNTAAVKAYIACVAQGVNLEVYSGRDAGQLLYAAQVALTMHKEK